MAPARRDTAVLWWMGVAVLLVAVRMISNKFMPGLAHDSFQYLGVADQALHGRLGVTSLVHFDAERSFSTIPAPMVTFPLGYPAMVALVGVTGIALPRAALLVNIAAALACVPLLWWITGRLALHRRARQAAVAFMAVNGTFLAFATTASTEMLFTVLVLAAVALLLRARTTTEGTSHWTGWIAAGIALGLAYHVRYAGIFLVLALGPIALRHLAVRRRDVFGGYAVAGIAASMLVVAGMVRNIMLVGNWRGGNEKAVSNALGEVMRLTLRAVDGVLLGPLSLSGSPPVIARVLFLVLALMVVALFLYRRSGARPTRHPDATVRSFSLDVVMLVATYAAFMFYAALTTVISYGPRMFMPMIPLLAVLVGVGVSAVSADSRTADGTPGRPHWALAAAFAMYAVLNLLTVRAPLVDRASPVLAQISSTTDSGERLRDVIDRVAGPDGVMVANNGQALGYLLGRRTVSLVGPHYSAIAWDEAAVREVVERFSTSVVVITMPNPLQPADSDLIPSTFVGSLASGRHPPWLQLVSRAGPVTVYVPSRAGP